MRYIFLFIFFLVGFVNSSFATHNRAGEISYTKVDPNDPSDFRYEICIVTCTKASSPADRPWLSIRYGDEPNGAPLDSIPRVNADPPIGTDNEDDSRVNTYKAIHTYPGAGSYIISMEDPNRNGGVINMDESISQVFYIESLLVITAFGGHNNSVRLLYPAKDEACINSIWEHNPGAYDIDGDSLAYSLIPCRGLLGNIIPSWEIPNLIPESDGVDDSFDINPLSGTISWDSPVIAGEYNIAVKIEEYRNGFLVGYVIRDMQIQVRNCQNDPPVVSVIQDTCVIAGEELELFLTATDDNSFVTLTAVGAPMSEVNNLATFNDLTGNPATGQFEWEPQCEEVRPAPYQVLFVGEDSFNNAIDLVDIMEVNITVIAPRTENLTVEPLGLSFSLNWDSHVCDEVVAYKIYKRSGFYGFTPSHCETGVPDYTGYELLTTVIAPETSYVDSENVDFGVQSCYMIVACLANGSESIASEEICASIDLIIPVITKVSVGATDLSIGKDTVWWAPPVSEDTLLLTSPYRFKLYSDQGFNGAQTLIHETPTNEFIGNLNRTFVHENINTSSTPNNYRVDLEDAVGNIVSSQTSSSLFLSITPNDNQLTLSWDYQVSWENLSFDIYKFNSVSSTFEFLASTEENSYTDLNLTNNVDYCYYVQSSGTFNSELESLPDPTINLSQEACAFPVDLTAPCPPELSASSDCDLATVSMVWNNPNEVCADDVTGYNIYYKPFIDSDYELIEVISGDDLTNFDYVNEQNITGCFYVTAVDSLLPGLGGLPNQNESVPSAEFCFESCPEIILPNVISPQGDGFNDFFEPFNFAYIDSIDLKIFNRWGSLVFETTDPAIKWNGVNDESDKISSDGVYFYVIKIFTSKLTGIHEETRSGTVTIFDGQKQNTD